jgi:hypothetical protein
MTHVKRTAGQGNVRGILLMGNGFGDAFGERLQLATDAGPA